MSRSFAQQSAYLTNSVEAVLPESLIVKRDVGPRNVERLPWILPQDFIQGFHSSHLHLFTFLPRWVVCVPLEKKKKSGMDASPINQGVLITGIMFSDSVQMPEYELTKHGSSDGSETRLSERNLSDLFPPN